MLFLAIFGRDAVVDVDVDVYVDVYVAVDRKKSSLPRTPRSDGHKGAISEDSCRSI